MSNIRYIIDEIHVTPRILILYEYQVSTNPGKFCRWYSIWKFKTSFCKAFIGFDFSHLLTYVLSVLIQVSLVYPMTDYKRKQKLFIVNSLVSNQTFICLL